MEKLIELDKKVLLFFNGYHHEALDPLVLLITQTVFWIPLYAFFIFLLFKHYKKNGWWFIVGAIVTILISDQVTASLMKPFFARLRPSQDPSLAGLVHLVDNYKGGLYGFASSHAANTFGVSLFMWLSLRHVYRWIVLAFLWAGIMTYTRIYLGVHFPGDILVGAAVGLMGGWIGYQVTQKLMSRKVELS